LLQGSGAVTLRAVFMGTPDIAVPALEALCELADVRGVVCQPDRPAGRGMKLRPPAVKTCGLERGLTVVQPTKLRTGAFASWLREQAVDVALVIAYGRILPPDVLAVPAAGCLNLHASLLPRYRGAAPINWAIAGGETETGISLMQMDAGCDTGPVFTMRALPIGERETAGELAERLARLAAKVVREDLPRALRGELLAVPQDETLATHARMMIKQDGRIDWSRPAKDVHDHVRGMTPWPGAYAELGGQRFKLLATERDASDTVHDAPPGRILDIDKRCALIACGDGCIRLLRGQVAGKKALDVAALAAGRSLTVGMSLA
jgi:methionyl-tRNA formyltransferase